MLSKQKKAALQKHLPNLKSIIVIGKNGLTENVLKEISSALLHHELLKIKFLESAQEEQDAIAARLCEQLDADLVESRGHTITIFKPDPVESKYKL